jgi:hypothetical protein
MIKFTTIELDWIYAAISQELDDHVCADYGRNAEIIAMQHDLLAKVTHAYVIASREDKD